MARLFDAYIMVDWSAAAKPATGANSIWIGIAARDVRLKTVFTAANPDTRVKAVSLIKDIIAKLNRRGDRVLLGFDFSLGYPAGTAQALKLDLNKQAPWQAMHELLAAKFKDKPDNSNSRFAIAAGFNYKISEGPFPFWGAPKRDQVKTLGPKRPDFENAVLPEYRMTELAMREAGIGNPKSSWQLAYAGSVGSQSLLGIPHVHALRRDLPNARLWPFELGFGDVTEETLKDVQTVIAEIYPSALDIVPEKGEILDRAQVRTMAMHYAALDQRTRLEACFAAPNSPDTGKMLGITAEEGWILSV